MTSFFKKNLFIKKTKPKPCYSNNYQVIKDGPREVAHTCYPSSQAEAGRLLPSVSPASSIQRDLGQSGVPSTGCIGRDKQQLNKGTQCVCN